MRHETFSRKNAAYDPVQGLIRHAVCGRTASQLALAFVLLRGKMAFVHLAIIDSPVF